MKPGDSYDDVLRELDRRHYSLRRGVIALTISHFLLVLVVAVEVLR